jgi:hypothetical protein
MEAVPSLAKYCTENVLFVPLTPCAISCFMLSEAMVERVAPEQVSNYLVGVVVVWIALVVGFRILLHERESSRRPSTFNKDLDPGRRVLCDR